MKNLQNQQNLQTENPYESLDKLGKDLVDLKLSDLTYQQISNYLEKLGEKREIQTLRDWFAEGGKYHEAYKFMKELRRKEIEPEFQAVDDQIKEGAIDAIGVVRDKIKQGNLKAAMYMLKLAGFEIDQVKHINSDSEGVALLREILERSDKKHGQQSSSADQVIQS